MTFPATPAVQVTSNAFRLAEVNPGNTAPFLSKDAAQVRLLELRARLNDLQENLYAEHQRSLLLVFQAMDTGGKDGAIEKLLTGVNPAGVHVTSFKRPSTDELAHDFLWRVHPHAPGRGYLGVFNRSHYEDVLITRVHGHIDEATVRQRYADINAFERLLTNSGTRILKFFLHISKEEQALRLQARLDDPAKHWKFDPNDLQERRLWPAYQQAYEEALRHCSPPESPWLVVPANEKWARDLALAEIVVATLEDMNPQPPTVDFDPGKMVIE